MNYQRALTRPLVLCILFIVVVPPLSAVVQAQDMPPQRQLRTFIPPDQIVNFLPSAPFSQFLETLNPIFLAVTGKRVIDPESRSQAIGVSIVGTHFFDAFQMVLEIHGLSYRETDQYFIIEAAPTEQTTVIQAPTATPGARQTGILATSADREIQIEAILFEVNLSKARELGTNWASILERQTGGGGSGSDDVQPRFYLRTSDLLSGLDEWLLSPSQVNLQAVARFFRVAETDGLGRTLANPSVTVKSGQKGRIQIGSDIPIQTRDFAGNTLTQFAQTGIIIDVTPTLIRDFVSDEEGAPSIEFMHLDVQVERSAGRPFENSIAIDRSLANTKVLLLDGEMTSVGGLYSTELTSSRRGVPILKDLPPWFFGIRYLFGYEVRRTAEKELVIVIQAHLRDPLPVRAARGPGRDVLNNYRRQVLETLDRFNRKMGEEFPIRPEGVGPGQSGQTQNPPQQVPPPRPLPETPQSSSPQEQPEGGEETGGGGGGGG